MKVLRRRPERTSQNRVPFLDGEAVSAVAGVEGRPRASSLRLSPGAVPLGPCAGVVMGGVMWEEAEGMEARRGVGRHWPWGDRLWPWYVMIVTEGTRGASYGRGPRQA